MPLGRRLTAEGPGTAVLLAIVIGWGIMGDRLAVGNGAIALLANSLATGCGLGVVILTFALVSGAHFLAAVSFTTALQGESAMASGSGDISSICH